MVKMMGLAAAASLSAASAVPANVETVQLTVDVAVDAPAVWDAVRDVYAVDTRLVPGMVTKVERKADVRTVTFANGFVVNERILGIDDKTRRITYSAFGDRATYHFSSLEVVALNPKTSRVVWTTQFLPAELRPLITQNMSQALAIMKGHLEASAER